MPRTASVHLVQRVGDERMPVAHSDVHRQRVPSGREPITQSMGLMLRPMVNLCVFSPPLVITRAQIDEMFDILHEGIVRAQHEVEAQVG